MSIDNGSEDNELLHSCGVYLYLYDHNKGSYTQQTDSVVGCALLSLSRSISKFQLLYYNNAKEPLYQIPISSSLHFTLQPDHYVNFYDHEQRNFSMRFKGSEESRSFLRAITYTIIQTMLVTKSTFKTKKSKNDPIIFMNDIFLGKDDGKGYAVQSGDTVGVSYTRWEDTYESSLSSFSWNPLEIESKRKPADAMELKKLIVDEDDDSLSAIDRTISLQALNGMHRNGMRIILVIYPSLMTWYVIKVELIKIKKQSKENTINDTNPRPIEPIVESKVVGMPKASNESNIDKMSSDDHDDLVQRMATLSRAGSGSGIIADLTNHFHKEKGNGSRFPSNSNSRRSSHLQNNGILGDQALGIKVELPGMQLSRDSERGNTQESIVSDSKVSRFDKLSMDNGPTSTIAKLLESGRSASTDINLHSSPQLNVELEALLKEQEELNRMREQLVLSKSDLSTEDKSDFPVKSSQDANEINYSQTAWRPKASPFEELSAFENTESQIVSTSLTNSFQPTSNFPSAGPNLNIGSSVRPTSILPQMPPAFPQYTIANLPSQGVGSYENSNVEHSLNRLQHTTSSLESGVQDLHSKIDRLLSLQTQRYSSNLVSKYASSVLHPPSFGSSQSSVSGIASQSTQSLLKSMEKALQQRDQALAEAEKLRDVNTELESSCQDLQQSIETLQIENQNLFEKLQNSNQLQQEKNRIELRTVQQKLHQSQDQVLKYQEENYRLRQSVGTVEERLSKEKQAWDDQSRAEIDKLRQQIIASHSNEAEISRLRTLEQENAALKSEIEGVNRKLQTAINERQLFEDRVHELDFAMTNWKNEELSKSKSNETLRISIEKELISKTTELQTVTQRLEQLEMEKEELSKSLLSRNRELEILTTKHEDKSRQEYSSLSEVVKELMNDIYFHFQDAFDENSEFTGKEVVMAVRKILKQNTLDVLAKLDDLVQKPQNGS